MTDNKLTPKEKFIESELRLDSIHAAFQRNNIYGANAGDKQRKQVRDYLDKLLIESQANYEREIPCSSKHIENIESLAKQMTEQFGSGEILHQDRFRLGTAQKALNLYLKYLWCLDKIKTPPHCPFDRIIIDQLYEHLEEEHRTIKWTEMTVKNEYEALVAAARQANDITDRSLAEWELDVYQRR